jgi:L-lysine exporter family protein LysE/ArgO
MIPSGMVTGFALAASLIVAIGAQNAFVLRQGLRREHVAAIVLFCVSSDVVLIGAGVAGLAHLLKDAPLLTKLLTIAGAAFLAWYGGHALWRASRPATLHGTGASPALTRQGAITQVAGFTLLNPHVYLDTVLLMGAVGARQPDGQHVWFVGGAGLASCVWFTALGFGARWLTPLFAKARAWQILDSCIALIMFALATRLTWQGLQG